MVARSFNLDSTYAVVSCASCSDALAITADRAPDLILCDIMMPNVDGPAMLTRLRESASTAQTPVVFMTARAEPRDLDRLKALGAVAVITKPFDPMTLADTVRGHVRLARLAAANRDFIRRLRADATTLTILRKKLRSDEISSITLESLQSCAHKLAGAAGVFNFQAVSCAASALEESIIKRRTGRDSAGEVEASLDALLECIERE